MSGRFENTLTLFLQDVFFISFLYLDFEAPFHLYQCSNIAFAY